MARAHKPIKLTNSEPAKYGLINSKTLVTDEDDSNWVGGFSIDQIGCSVGIRNIDTCSVPHEVDDVVLPQGLDIDSENFDYTPFTVEAYYECSTFGFTEADYFRKAVQVLDIAQHKAVEHEFWTGSLDPNNMHLSSINAQVVGSSGTPVRPDHGVALLEDALANCGYGQRGFIHATRGATAAMTVLDKKSEVLKTQLGTYVIAGTGYTGTGPGGIQPTGTQSWMYATGHVSVLLGKPEAVPGTLAEAVDRETNSVSVTASKFAGAVWEGCCHFAVLVDLALEY